MMDVKAKQFRFKELTHKKCSLHLHCLGEADREKGSYHPTKPLREGVSGV